MPATRDGKLWRSQFYYKDWQGVRRKKNKRGFKTKGEADEWERKHSTGATGRRIWILLLKLRRNYLQIWENRLRESTIINSDMCWI